MKNKMNIEKQTGTPIIFLKREHRSENREFIESHIELRAKKDDFSRSDEYHNKITDLIKLIYKKTYIHAVKIKKEIMHKEQRSHSRHRGLVQDKGLDFSYCEVSS